MPIKDASIVDRVQVNQSKVSHWNPLHGRRRHPRVVRGASHLGKKWRSVLWLNAMYSGKKVMNSRLRTPFSLFFLNPDYVAARSLRSLCSNNYNRNASIGKLHEHT